MLSLKCVGITVSNMTISSELSFFVIAHVLILCVVCNNNY